MTRDELSSIILDSQGVICYISDPRTYEILYVSKAGEKSFGLENGYDGHKCYELFRGFTKPCEHCANQLLANGGMYTWEYHNEKTDSYYLLRDMLIIVDGKEMRLEFAYNITAWKKRERELDARLSLEETLIRCIYTLAEESNVNVALNGLLSIVCDYHAADGVCIFECDYNSATMSNTYDWCKSGAECRLHDSQRIPLDAVEELMRRLRRDGVFYVGSPGPPIEKFKFLCERGVASFMAVPLEAKGDLIGLLAVSNPTARLNDFRLLRSIPFFVLDDLSKRRMIAELERMSYVDDLTGLFNRNKYTEVLKRIGSEEPKHTGVIYLDINGLKAANDTYGHSYGDRLIGKMSSLIKSHFADSAFRVGGDEFIVLCRGIGREEFERKVGELRAHMELEKDLSFSIGSNWSEGDVDLVRQIVRADELMYINKQSYYKATLTSQRRYRSNAARALLGDIQSGKFVVYLQPKVDLSNGRIVGAEALVRRKDPEGIVLPVKFIPVYETEGIIRHLDFFVLDTVCATLAEWNSLGVRLPVAINLSRITLMENGIVASIGEICGRHAVDPSRIELEVTETIGKMDTVVLSRLLQEFRACGFLVSLDDFGSDYSNLAILASVEFNEVKMDKSLVSSICDNARSRIIVEHAIRICHSFGQTHTLAEGIETEEQRRILNGFQCQFGQGNLFSKPLPIPDFYGLYRRQAESESGFR